MQDIDTGKLRDILEIMREFGAAYLRADGVDIGLFNQAVSEPPKSAIEVDPVAAESRTVQPRTSGYTALFGETLPKFPTAG